MNHHNNNKLSAYHKYFIDFKKVYIYNIRTELFPMLPVLSTGWCSGLVILQCL